MPGVQKPHCRPCSSLNPSWIGCSSLGPARPSTVVISWPSACTPSIVQLLTGVPSNNTVQAPQFVVSHPVCVPVRPRPWRSRCASSSRGSTSATRFTPLTVMLTRRVGTSPTAWSRTSLNKPVMSCCPLGRLLDACQDALDEGAYDLPLVLRASAVIRPRLGRLRGQVGGGVDAL